MPFTQKAHNSVLERLAKNCQQGENSALPLPSGERGRSVRLDSEVRGDKMLEENSQIFSVRIYASSGASPGRGGPFGAASFFVIPAEAGIQGFPWKREPIVFKWFPAFAGTSSGLRLEFIPMKIGAGVTGLGLFIRLSYLSTIFCRYQFTKGLNKG